MILTLIKNADKRRYTAIARSFEDCATGLLATLSALDPQQAECAQHALHAMYVELKKGAPIHKMFVSSNVEDLACTIMLDETEELSRN